jgi:ribosomal protein S18 acetylase RimI-like enzyme
MIFRPIDFGSSDYRAEWELREAVLRKPLGLSLANEDLTAECDHFHFGLFAENGDLIGSVIAVPLGDGIARLRQMAVRPDFSGQGHGAHILRELEADLRRRGFHRIVLHARKTATGFYQKSGYAVTGPEANEIGIPHFPMAKAL